MHINKYMYIHILTHNKHVVLYFTFPIPYRQKYLRDSGKKAMI